MEKLIIRILLPVVTLIIAGIILFSWLKNSYADSTNKITSQIYTDQDIRSLYMNYCAGCHGERLERFNRSNWIFEETDEMAIQSIKYGREEVGMPAFEKTFTDEQIQAMAKYIRAEIPMDDNKRKPAFSMNQVVKSEKQNFTVDTVVTGLHVPWGMEFLPNGDILISERSGALYRFSDGRLNKIENLPEIVARNQGGLLDLHLHPDYEENGWIYFAYSDPSEGNKQKANTSIMRARLSGNKMIDKEKIFDGIPDSPKVHHWGCKIEFDKEGYLWFGIGDRGSRDVYPQMLDNHNGKIHRIHDDGTIPEDNPFVNTKGAMPSIYSYGHRNPQGTSMHPETGEIWITEHGPKGGDELNLIQPGLNYGWPVISYGINYNGTKFTDLTHKEGMEQPIIYWDPSIAPCGMTFVNSDRYPGWKNNIMIGSLRFEYLERVELSGNQVVDQEKLLEGIGRVRNVVVGPNGYIYVATEKPGFIVKLLPVN